MVRRSTLARLVAIAVLAPLLGGCLQTFTSSVAGSCKVFERPPYAVRGVTRYDQDVADNFVESGVAGCNWQRPAPRPASIDAQPVRQVKAVPAKRRGLLKRIRDRVLTPPPAEVPIEPPAPVEALPDPIVVPPPAPRAPRSAIDELLYPQDLR